MKIYTLSYVNKEGKGIIEAFPSDSKARGRMREVQEDCEFMDGVDVKEFDPNRAGVISAIEWASANVFR